MFTLMIPCLFFVEARPLELHEHWHCGYIVNFIVHGTQSGASKHMALAVVPIIDGRGRPRSKRKFANSREVRVR